MTMAVFNSIQCNYIQKSSLLLYENWKADISSLIIYTHIEGKLCSRMRYLFTAIYWFNGSEIFLRLNRTGNRQMTPVSCLRLKCLSMADLLPNIGVRSQQNFFSVWILWARTVLHSILIVCSLGNQWMTNIHGMCTVFSPSSNNRPEHRGMWTKYETLTVDTFCFFLSFFLLSWIVRWTNS